VKIKILNRTYDLKVLPVNLAADRGNWGVIDHCNLEIQISNNIENTIKFETFIHECLHSIDNQLNLDFDEKIIDKISCGIMSLLENNDLQKVKLFLK
jgi:hypothetical protein